MDNRTFLIPHIFSTPEVFFGKDSSSLLKYIDKSRVLAIVSKSVSKTDHYRKISEYTSWNEQVVQSPDLEDITEISQDHGDMATIVAIGGGSVLDAAKVIRHFIQTSSIDFQKIGKLPEVKKVGLIAIPTTPGTGSHTTPVSVVKNQDNTKTPYVSTVLLPDTAILDSNFLVSLNKEYMFYAAADILSHNMEGYVSRLSNSLIRSLSMTSMQMLEEGIKEYEMHQTPEKIFLAGHLAGLVQGNAFVGLCHAVAHSIESMTGANHGYAILNILANGIEWLGANDDSNSYEKFMNSYMKMGLEKYRTKHTFNSLDTAKLVELAMKDPSVRTSPVRISQQIVEDAVKCLIK